MTKSDFLERLAAELKRHHVSEPDEIIDEYREHFAFKLADGYSEEEIATKLGALGAIAAQYVAAPAEGGRGKKAITAIGLGAVDFCFGLLCVLLYAWEIVMGALVLALGALSVVLMGNLTGEIGWAAVPGMPYPCALLMGVAAAALTVLAAVGAVCYFQFIRQLMRSYGRFHANTLASAAGKAPLPPVTAYPRFTAGRRRALRKVTMTAATVFAVCFVTGFAACAISAGHVEFWHAWGWFGYGG